MPVTGSGPRRWQPYRPGDEEFRPLVHRIVLTVPLPATVKPGWHQLGLWLPDAGDSLRLDPRYSIRAANRDVPWWTDSQGRYGINVLGMLEVPANVGR
ncbi:MAG: hypothetical protein HUU20_11495 [Pirellulales bacterium]|nr:hypothetical protein [Pirellulales bacterium]